MEELEKFLTKTSAVITPEQRNDQMKKMMNEVQPTDSENFKTNVFPKEKEKFFEKNPLSTR